MIDLLLDIKWRLRKNSPTLGELQILEALVKTSPEAFKDISRFTERLRQIWEDTILGYSVSFSLTDLTKSIEQRKNVGEARYIRWNDKSRSSFQTFVDEPYGLEIMLTEEDSIRLGRFKVYVNSEYGYVYPQKDGGTLELVLEDRLGNKLSFPLNKLGVTEDITIRDLGSESYKATLR